MEKPTYEEEASAIEPLFIDRDGYHALPFHGLPNDYTIRMKPGGDCLKLFYQQTEIAHQRVPASDGTGHHIPALIESTIKLAEQAKSHASWNRE